VTISTVKNLVWFLFGFGRYFVKTMVLIMILGFKKQCRYGSFECIFLPKKLQFSLLRRAFCSFGFALFCRKVFSFALKLIQQ